MGASVEMGQLCVYLVNMFSILVDQLVVFKGDN